MHISPLQDLFTPRCPANQHESLCFQYFPTVSNLISFSRGLYLKLWEHRQSSYSYFGNKQINNAVIKLKISYSNGDDDEDVCGSICSSLLRQLKTEFTIHAGLDEVYLAILHTDEEKL